MGCGRNAVEWDGSGRLREGEEVFTVVAVAGGDGVCDGGWARARSVLVFLSCHIDLVCIRARLLSTPLWTALLCAHGFNHTQAHTHARTQV